jgi:hypothetical protein
MIRTRSVLLAGLFLATAPVVAQGQVLPYLPKTTVLAITAPNITSSLARFQKMPLAKMWAEQEVQNFTADLKSFLEKKLDELMAQGKQLHADGELPFDPTIFRHLRLESCTFALTRLELEVGNAGPEPKIGLMAHLHLGPVAPEVHGLVKMGLDLLEQNGPPMNRAETKVGEVVVLSMKPAAEATPMSLSVALVPGGLLIGTLEEEVKEVVQNLQNKTLALGGTPAYLATAKHLKPQNAEMETFLRLDPMVDFAISALRVASQMSPEMAAIDMDGVERAITAMGLRNLGNAGSTSSYEDGKSVTREFSTTSTSDQAVDMGFLKWVPKDAVSFSAGSLPISQFYESIMKGLDAYDPEFAKEMMTQLAELENQLGFRLREDLFQSFGDRYVTWMMPVANMNAAPETAILIQVKDEKKIVQVMKGLAKLTQGMVEIEESERRGLKSYQLRINAEEIPGLPFNPLQVFQPTMAFKGDYMVVAFTPSDVKRAMQRMDREDDPKGDIRSNKEFLVVASQIPAKVSSVTFSDWKVQFESFYSITTGLMAAIPMGQDVPIDPALLPESNTLTQHLFPTISYTSAHEGGTMTVTTSPFGPETLMMVGFLIGAGAATFGVMSQRGF